jgi:NAD(P)-dependent dehydrogenase (short-subunit alcohol dehydrogenase family)
MDLSDQTLLITGASRGIGRAIARTCADAGATVAVHYGRSEDAAREVADACGNGSAPVQADLADLEATDALFGAVVDRFGTVDGLVNNAGVAVSAPFDASSDRWAEAWTQTMTVNLRAPEILCRHAVRHFQSRTPPGGRIVNVASRAAFRGDTPDYTSYASSKAGLVALTKSLARAFGGDDITAFSIAPGFTRTDMAQDFIDTYGEAHATSDLALNRLTEPEDIAPTVAFLLSGNADHATGTTIDLNAGSYVH